MTQRKQTGFGSMNPERQKEIARMGGLEAHRSGRAHKFTSDEARAAGLKSGEAKRKKRAASTQS